jgi:hypothetical protein
MSNLPSDSTARKFLKFNVWQFVQLEEFSSTFTRSLASWFQKQGTFILAYNSEYWMLFREQKVCNARHMDHSEIHSSTIACYMYVLIKLHISTFFNTSFIGQKHAPHHPWHFFRSQRAISTISDVSTREMYTNLKLHNSAAESLCTSATGYHQQ